MARYAIIENGVVTNVIEADAAFAASIGAILAGNAGVGYLWSEGVFSAPQPTPPTRDELKASRELAVSQIKVTTTLGNTFDGDELAQGRMARAIIAMQATGAASTLWVLADNTVITATVAELAEALALSGAAQSAVWVIP